MNLSNLIRDAMKMQGIDAFDIVIASADGDVLGTTLIDTTLEDKYGDDELKDGTVLVLSTTSSLPPQDEFSRISVYTESSQQATFSAMSAQILAGTTCMIIAPDYPLRVLIELANDALRDCGEISLTDENSSTVAGQYEYELPIDGKHLVDVFVRNYDGTGWDSYQFRRVIPSAAGVYGSVEFKDELPADRTIQFVYNAYHPRVTLYNDPINEAIPSQLAVLILADKIMQWHGVTDENTNSANKINSEMENAKRNTPVRKELETSKLLIFKR